MSDVGAPQTAGHGAARAEPAHPDAARPDAARPEPAAPRRELAPPRTVRRPLSWRAEARRQLRRRRTLWSFGVLLALPLIMVLAFALGDGEGDDGAGGAPRFVDLATTGSANFTIFTVFATADLLLVILAALFVGDTVPSEASWSTLRYLLAAPVARARLLTSKLVVGLASTGAAVVLLAVWALLVGGLAYGWQGFTGPTGTGLPWGTFLVRMALVLAYLWVTVLQVAALAFLLGVRTDAPLAAVGGAVLVVIVSSILDAIDTLGDLRQALPMHWSRAWTDLLVPVVDWTDLRRGVLWSLLWTVVLLALAYRHFGRKDVQS
ncbi:MAG TPA: ABC transporter permease [Dermatophilaceae bacterium]|nr:ABC transporter permease [Dermatophilaceae bacterium]